MKLPRPFGPYTLLRRLAVGGMAEIYVAKTLGLGGFEKLAALKLVHPHLSADPQFVRMLIDEAKILVLLTHTNIAQVFDLGSIDGTYYIAMEYVDGVDVQGLERAAARLGRALPIPICCFIVSELLNGLDYAHRKCDLSGRPLGIVHRDISPQNVVVSRAGEVKLVDFGIAKTNLRADGTEVGVIKGKYGYMSPEQAWADPTDGRSDVFSAGVMLYELLTGRALYTAKSVAELIAKVRKAEIPWPTTQRAEIPEPLSAIVMRALALEPSERYQTALEMGDALREFLYRSVQAFSGARLGRFVDELLEADEKLAAESAQTADRTGGLRALRREDFVRSDSSMLFAVPETGAATRSEALPGRGRGAAEARDARGALARLLSCRRKPKSKSKPPEVEEPPPSPPRPEPPARSPASAAHSEPEDLSELWTARWFAERAGSLEIAPEIRVQKELSAQAPERRHAGGVDPSSVAPPTLSWPPFALSGAASGPTRSLRRLAPAALVPPRGEDPSLGPLPPVPNVPEFRRAGASRVGRRELGFLLFFVMLGALGALIARESGPPCAIEILSVPSGASVRIDGALQPGKTPLRVSGLRRGAHYRLQVELPGYQRHHTDLRARPGTERHVFQLEPQEQ